MSCATYFDPTDLESSSIESEIGWSSYCIPNQVKAGILGALLVFATLDSIFIGVTCVRTYFAYGGWTKKLIIMTGSFVGAFAIMLISAVLLAGVQSPARYILYWVPPTSFINAGVVIVLSWCEALESIITQARNDASLQLVQRLMKIFGAFSALVFFLLYTALPLGYADDPVALNWCFSFGISALAMSSVVIAASDTVTALRLKKICQPTPDTPLAPEIAKVVKKLDKVARAASVFGVAMFLVAVFPLWMGFTVEDESQPGLSGHFYFYYAYLLNQMLLGAFIMTWLRSQRASETGGGSSDNKNSRSSEPSAFPSIPIEELNGVSP